MRNRRKVNLFKILLILLFLFLLYSQNRKLQNLNKRLTDIEEKRLKLIEDKFGGSKNLKCNETETIRKIRPSFEPAPKIVFFDNAFETGEILYADKDADLAVLKVGKKLPSGFNLWRVCRDKYLGNGRYGVGHFFKLFQTKIS